MEDPSLPLRIAVLNEEGQSAHEPLMHDIDQPAEAMVTGIRASGAAISPRPTTRPSCCISPKANKHIALPEATWPSGTAML